MSAFQVTITTGAGTPIYRQIVDQVRLAVATGALPAGQTMPSVRELAERLRRLRQAADDFIHEAVFLDFTADEIRQAVDDKLAALDWGAKPTGA